MWKSGFTEKNVLLINDTYGLGKYISGGKRALDVN